MDCRDVKNKLPYYLSGQCSPEEKLEISKHLSNCTDCMKELEQLEKPIFDNMDYPKSLDTGRLLSRARNALIVKVASTTILSIIIFISIIFTVIPGILKIIRYPQVPDITRALVDITQFTSPSPVGGYGNSLASFGKYSFNVRAYTYDIAGTKQKGSGEVERKFNMITGTFQSPVQLFTQFSYPDVAVSDELLKSRTPDNAKKILIKNGTATVAVADISLKSLLSLEEVTASLKGLDVKVVWMAVECGNEGFKPKNMSSGDNQYVQWGVPGKLFSPDSMGSAGLDYKNPLQYEKAVINELKWLDNNKHYISADNSLMRFQGFDNSVSNNAKYIINNGLKVYGLRITGPSTELAKLDKAFDIRMEEVKDIDFYYWN